MGLLSKLFSSKPKPPRIVVEQRPWVMVYDVPTDAGWQVQDDEREGEGFIVQVLRLVRTDDRLVLMAKDYSGDVDDSLDELRACDWRARYAPSVFDAVTDVRVAESRQTLMDRVVPALDVRVDGTTPDGPQRIRERYACVPGHKLIITAAGTVAAHERFAPDVERWFADIAFRPR